MGLRKFLNRRRQAKILESIEREIKRKYAGNAAIDQINFENKDLFMVCPSCFNISKALRPGYAVQRESCTCCGSEGFEINLISVQEVLQKNDLNNLKELLDKITEQSNLRSEWKNMMCKSVEKLIELKKQESQSAIIPQKQNHPFFG